MGTGILSTLTQTLHGSIPGGQVMAVALLVIGWVALIGLTGAFALGVARRPARLAETVRQIPVLVTWGMVAMGMLSVGSATATVIPVHWPAHAHAAIVADAVLWTLGTGLGVLTALDFGLRLVGRDVGSPAATWGLPVVPPMVSATTGGALIGHLGSRPAQIWMLMATVGCFFLSLVLGLLVFAVAYNHHWRVKPLPIIASTTAWIPLGVVGQSTAAAQTIARRSETFLRVPDVATVQQIANVYGFVMLTIGIPLVGWAVAMTVRGFRQHMPFVPGWWALTFPIGTLCLGSHLLATGSGLDGYQVASVGACLALVGTWTLCAVATIRAVAGAVVRAA